MFYFCLPCSSCEQVAKQVKSRCSNAGLRVWLLHIFFFGGGGRRVSELSSQTFLGGLSFPEFFFWGGRGGSSFWA